MRRISLLCVTCAAAMMVAGGCASMSGTLKGGLIGGGGGTAVGAGIGALAHPAEFTENVQSHSPQIFN